MENLTIYLDRIKKEINVKVVKYIKMTESKKKYLIYEIYDQKTNSLQIEAGEVVETKNDIMLVDINDSNDLQVINKIIGDYYD